MDHIKRHIGRPLDGTEEEVIINKDGSFCGRYCVPLRKRAGMDPCPKHVSITIINGTETRYVMGVVDHIKTKVIGTLESMESTAVGYKFRPTLFSNPEDITNLENTHDTMAAEMAAEI